MPRIFEKEGFRFFFYSNEHLPVHVHVRYGGGEAVFELATDISLRDFHGLKRNELNKAERLVRENQTLIRESWYEHLG